MYTYKLEKVYLNWENGVFFKCEFKIELPLVSWKAFAQLAVTI